MLITLWLLALRIPRIPSADCSSRETSVRIVSPVLSQEKNLSTIRFPVGSALSVKFEINPVCNYTHNLIIEVDRRKTTAQRWLPLCSVTINSRDVHCHCISKPHIFLCNFTEVLKVPVKQIYRIKFTNKSAVFYVDVFVTGGDSTIQLFTNTKDILLYSDVSTNDSLYLMTSLESKQQDVKDTAFPPVIWISIAAANLLFFIILVVTVCVILKRKGNSTAIVNEVAEHGRKRSPESATGSKQQEEHNIHGRLYEEIPDRAIRPRMQSLQESAASIEQTSQVLESSRTAAIEERQLKQDMVIPCLHYLSDSAMLDQVDLPSGVCLEMLSLSNPKRCNSKIVSGFSHATLASLSSLLPQTTPTTSIATVQDAGVQKASPKVFPRVIIVNNPKPASPQHTYSGLRSPASPDNTGNAKEDCQGVFLMSPLKSAAENSKRSSKCPAEEYSKSSSNVLQIKAETHRRSSIYNATSSEETQVHVESPSKDNKLYIKPVDSHEAANYLHPTLLLND